MIEASPKARSQQTTPANWSTIPVSQRQALIALLVKLTQRRLAKQPVQEVVSDERRRTEAAR